MSIGVSLPRAQRGPKNKSQWEEGTNGESSGWSERNSLSLAYWLVLVNQNHKQNYCKNPQVVIVATSLQA